MFYPDLNVKISTIARAVYSQLGPGLPDKVYKECFVHELENSDLKYEKDPFIPVDYKGQILETGIYACFIIDSKIVLNIKSASESPGYHKSRLYNYMKLSLRRCGMILDFNSDHFSGVLKVFLR